MAPFPFPLGQRQSFSYRDNKGNVARVTMFASIQGTAVATDVRTLMVSIGGLITPLTWAALQSANGPWSEYGVAQYGAHNSGGAYESVIDKAVLVFQDAAGTLHRYEIPAPKVSIFKADKITVDPANTDVAALIAAMSGTPGTNSAFVTSRSGNFLANYMGGFYKARKIRRRLNVLVLQPDLTASLPAE